MIAAPGWDHHESSPRQSRRLWSLWDMLQENIEAYIELGERIHDARLIYQIDGNFQDGRRGEGPLNAKGEEEVRDELRSLLELAERLNLPASKKLLDRRLGYPDSTPQTLREFDIIVDFFKDEIRGRLFLFVPPHVAPYYEWDGIVPDEVVDAFPKASEEVRHSGTCLAAGLYTACVFHAMRAAEIGVRALGTNLNITIKDGKPIELAEWREILDGISRAVRDIENLPNSTPTKDADLLFYSEAAAQFRFFKNGWRVRVAHARATYTEPQAKEAIDHVRSFFELLATRLKE